MASWGPTAMAVVQETAVWAPCETAWPVDNFLVVPGAVKKVCVTSEHLICMSFGSQSLVVT